MKTLLLTIVGPTSTVDLTVSGDHPLGELIPALLDETGVAGDATTPVIGWTLAPPTGTALALDRSLSESGVVDGQVLRLRPASDHAETPRRIIAPTELPLVGTALARTRAALPPGPSFGDRLRGSGQYLVRLDGAIKAGTLRRCPTIAIVSPKGGVGKSTVSVLLGSLLARLRADRVIAVDTDADYGSLGPWLAPDHPVSVTELGAELERPDLLAHELHARLAVGPDGLRVCPTPESPVSMAALDHDHYERLIARLQELAGILVLDCGTGLGQPGAQAAIRACDQLVLVTDAAPATLAQVAKAGGLLRHAGKPTTVVVNRRRRDGNRAQRVDALFPHASNLLFLSTDDAAAELLSAGGFSWEEAPRSWQRDVRELVAVLVAAWPQLHLA